MGSNKQGAQKSCHYSIFKGWGFFFPSPYKHLVFIVLCSFRDQYIYNMHTMSLQAVSQRTHCMQPGELNNTFVKSEENNQHF